MCKYIDDIQFFFDVKCVLQEPILLWSKLWKPDPSDPLLCAREKFMNLNFLNVKLHQLVFSSKQPASPIEISLIVGIDRSHRSRINNNRLTVI